MTGFKTFLRWERTSRDTIDFKKAYVDMAGDVLAGLMLSQIVYWYLPGQSGDPKLRVERDRERWLVKSRHDWWDECRLSPREADRARKALEDAGLIEVKLYKFNGSPTQHIRIKETEFLKAWQRVTECDGQRQRKGPVGGGSGGANGNGQGESRASGSGEPRSHEEDTGRANLPKGFMSAAAGQAAGQANPLKSPISPNGEMDFTVSLNAFHQNGKMDFTKRLNPITEITTETTTAAARQSAGEAPGAAAALVRELVSHGVGRSSAERLAREKPDVCRHCLDYLPFASYRTTRGAWLANAIRDEYGPPAGYVQAKLREVNEIRERERALAENARKGRQEARRREQSDRLMERYRQMEKSQGNAFAAFTEHVARERAKLTKIVAHLSPERRVEQLAAFDTPERRLRLFEEWLKVEEGRGSLPQLAARPPPTQEAR